ncbi:hypothetical protein [Lutibacter sp.]
MKYKLLIIFFLSITASCVDRFKNKIIVFPEYCQGCVVRNFEALKNQKIGSDFEIYFDTTDVFVLQTANDNKLQFQHISNQDIPEKFGDYANLVVINSKGKTTELKTNETLTKGVHF